MYVFGRGFMKMRMNTMLEQQRNLKKNGGQVNSWTLNSR